MSLIVNFNSWFMYLKKKQIVLRPNTDFSVWIKNSEITFTPQVATVQGYVHDKFQCACTYQLSCIICMYHRIASKINDTLKGSYLSISKLHSILAVANLLAPNNISQICYCGQISSQSASFNNSFSSNLTPMGVPFILLVIVLFSLLLSFVDSIISFTWV